MTSLARRSGVAGFSLIELLVSIVMAAFVFAAMVPMFLGAEQKSSGDRMRNIASNLAQDRIEKIRSLPYNQITIDHLQSSTWGGGQFGQTWAANMGNTQKVFTIAYTLNPSTGGAVTSGSSPDHLQVTVKVVWTGNPKPAKTVQFDTVISKQFAGPAINSFNVAPTDSGTHLTITGEPMTLTAVVSAAAIAGMSPNGYVQFNIMPLGTGITPPSAVTVPFSSGTAGNTTYTTTWNPVVANYPDGQYSFTAQAFSTTNDAGHPVQQTLVLNLSSAPPMVTGLVAYVGDGRTVLQWSACPSTDFDHYEVWRGNSSGSETFLISLTANGYINTGLINDNDYYYQVYAVDKSGNKSPASLEATVTPTNLPADIRPTMPGSLAGVAAFNAAVLSWSASTDPDDGVAGYYIYRDGGTTPYANVPAGSLGITDTVGWAATHTYSVRAYDTVGRRSSWTSPVSVTTGARPGPFTLTIQRNKSSAVTTVTATDPSYSSGAKTSANTVTLSGLYYGAYTIVTTYPGYSNNIQTLTLSSSQTVTVNF
jgi:type II secretory pathway pseudopilin PulG